MDDDELPDDNPAERAQAGRLREQARMGGLRFEAYLPPALADWLLERVEHGLFADPAEAVFAIVGNFRDLEPHRDLRDELLRRTLERSLEDVKAGRTLPADEVFDRLQRRYSQPRPEPGCWQKIAR
jgi:Arc/MetJ-type ribon-helix-helix transcriptional regulator